jgi:hypothetical protein
MIVSGNDDGSPAIGRGGERPLLHRSPSARGSDIEPRAPFRADRDQSNVPEQETSVNLILLVVVIAVLFGGGGYYGHRRGYYGGNGLGIVGVLGIVLVAYLIFGSGYR